MTDAMRIGNAKSAPCDAFINALRALDGCPRILEIGTLRADPATPTHHKEWAPEGNWIMVDVSPGMDVDIVMDAHEIPHQWNESFHAVVAVAVWEHLARPWIAAESLADALMPDGIAYISTHQTFPLHGYPNDYFRFSKEALELIFSDAGLEVVASSYMYPCSILPREELTRWNHAAESFLVVDAFLRKPS